MIRDKHGLKRVPQKLITKRPNGTKRVQFVNVDANGEVLPSRTQQQFKKDCDVNEIVAKFKRTGSVTHVRNTQMGVYADLTALPVDLQEARGIVLRAEQAFEAVPAHIRARFGHDPKNMIDFLADPANDQEAVKLGLKTTPPPRVETPIETSLKNIERNTKQKSSQSKKTTEE